MTRGTRMLRTAILVVGLVSTSLALTSCAGPGIDELEANAQRAFDELVTAAEAADETVLRTLEVSGPEEQACGADDRGLQRAFVAVGSVSVGADDAAQGALVDAVTSVIDDEEWTPIDPEGIAGREGAWVDEVGVVATVSYDAPVLVIATFTPCVTAS